MRITLLLAIALLLVGAVPAQVKPVVLPDASLANSLGSANNNIPFSWQPTRYQQVFNNLDMGGGNLFRFLQMRPASGFNKPNYGGQMVDMAIQVGPTTVDETTCTGTFATNLPKPFPAIKRRWVHLPKFRATGPTDWQVTIPFDLPYPWPGGTNHFCVEVVNYGNTNNNALFTYPLDAVNSSFGPGARTCRIYASGNPTATTGTIGRNYGLVMRFTAAVTTEGWFSTYGTSCVGSNGTPVYGADEVPRIGDPLTLKALNLVPGAAALFGLGRSNSRFLSFQLPLDLGLFGAKGCSLYTEVLLVVSAQADNTGLASTGLTVPKDNALVGVDLYSQWFSLDLKANPLGLVSTYGANLHLGS